MAEINTPRLMAAAKEFNIGTNTLIDFLVSKSFSSDDLKPSTKLTEEMYRVLQVEFQPDKVAKQKAEQIDLPKNAPADSKKRKDEQDLSFTKKETVKAKVEKLPVAETVEATVPEETIIKEPTETVEEKTPTEKSKKPKEEIKPEAKETNDTEITRIEAPEVEGIKVVDKIDLTTIDSSVRPKKDTKKIDTKSKTKAGTEKEAPVEKKPQPVEPEIVKGPAIVPEKVVPEVTNIKFVKLEGPNLLMKGAREKELWLKKSRQQEIIVLMKAHQDLTLPIGHMALEEEAGSTEMLPLYAAKKKRLTKRKFRIRLRKHRRNSQVPEEEVKALKLNIVSKREKKLLKMQAMK